MIPNAQDLLCKVLRFNSLFGSLTIGIYDRTGISLHEVLFSLVAYFRCPMEWRGATFSVAPRHVLMELMSRRYPPEEPPDDALDKRLFLVGAENSSLEESIVAIIAKDIYLLEER